MNGITNGENPPDRDLELSLPRDPKPERQSDWMMYKQAVEACIPTELTLPTTAYGIFSFLRKVILLREEPGMDTIFLNSKIENEWE